MHEWKIFLVEIICRKTEDSHENYDLMKKGEEKKKCHVKKYNTIINTRKKSLLELSARLEDRTKAHAKEVHPKLNTKKPISLMNFMIYKCSNCKIIQNRILNTKR